MKSAAVCILVCLVLVSPAFALLRPLFPVKAAPPFRGEVIVIGDDLVSGALPKKRVLHHRDSAMRDFTAELHDTVILVYDAAGNVIETHEHRGDFKEWWRHY